MHGVPSMNGTTIECTCDQTYTCSWHQAQIDASLAQQEAREGLETIQELRGLVVTLTEKVTALAEEVETLSTRERQSRIGRGGSL